MNVDAHTQNTLSWGAPGMTACSSQGCLGLCLFLSCLHSLQQRPTPGADVHFKTEFITAPPLLLESKKLALTITLARTRIVAASTLSCNLLHTNKPILYVRWNTTLATHPPSHCHGCCIRHALDIIMCIHEMLKLACKLHGLTPQPRLHTRFFQLFTFAVHRTRDM